MSVGQLPAEWYIVIPVATIVFNAEGPIDTYRVEVREQGVGAQTVVVGFNIDREVVQVGQPTLFYSTGRADSG